MEDREKRLSSEVRRVLEEIEEGVRAARAALGLSCPPGCGECCRSTEVEASVLEMIPVAEQIFGAGEADHYLGRLAATGDRSPCVFYSPDALCHGQGRCRVYPLRPSVCRLFGYAAVRSKSGRLVFSACKELKRLSPDRCEAARNAVASGLDVICFADAATRLSGLDPGLGWKKLPINRALREALERVAFARGWRDLETAP